MWPPVLWHQQEHGAHIQAGGGPLLQHGQQELQVEGVVGNQEDCNVLWYCRFYLSFENAICKDYVTEKIFNALMLNTIPIVLGGANYTKILPPGSFINAGQFESPRELANYLQLLLKNSTLYDSYFTWRPHYDIHR